MATSLKDILGHSAIRSLGAQLHSAHGALDRAAFVRDGLRGLEPLPLTQRASHLATVMRAHLPSDYESAADVITRSLGHEHSSAEMLGANSLSYLPHVSFVQQFGLDHFETSMQLQVELTKRFSAEFSIRAFIARFPERTHAQLVRWASDPNVHVRRLVSEGSRPRLPWATRLPEYQRDPAPVLELLELLKDDPERYVQRSVANNLNDIAKDHPAVVVETCARWKKGASESRSWIIGHALRSLVKQGNSGALELLGAGAAPKIEVRSVAFAPKSARIGDTVRISIEIASTSSTPQDLLVDYALHFVKANGQTRPKVFKLRRLELASRALAKLEARVSFADMTTRKHYPGEHRATLLVNGKPFELGAFTMRPRE